MGSILVLALLGTGIAGTAYQILYNPAVMSFICNIDASITDLLLNILMAASMLLGVYVMCKHSKGDDKRRQLYNRLYKNIKHKNTSHFG